MSPQPQRPRGGRSGDWKQPPEEARRLYQVRAKQWTHANHLRLVTGTDCGLVAFDNFLKKELKSSLRACILPLCCANLVSSARHSWRRVSHRTRRMGSTCSGQTQKFSGKKHNQPPPSGHKVSISALLPSPRLILWIEAVYEYHAGHFYDNKMSVLSGFQPNSRISYLDDGNRSAQLSIVFVLLFVVNCCCADRHWWP